MTPHEVRQRLGNVPHMSLEQGQRITRFVQEHQLRDILELGFDHGVSTCYLAAAAAPLGGHVTTIDLERARNREPNIEQLLHRAGHRDHVTIHFERKSYLWRLMRLLEDDTLPRFDLCYLDGAHNWYTDGLAFFLVDRLLRPGGWIIFDDLDWTYAASPALCQQEWVQNMPDEERTTAQVRKIYELLVKTHPDYEQCRVEGNWAFAQKKPQSSAVVSGNPNIKLKFCTAAPLAPLIRLSSALINRTRPRTTRAVISTKLV